METIFYLDYLLLLMEAELGYTDIPLAKRTEEGETA